MKTFIKDIFSEETPNGVGKFSAKRFMGIVVGLGALLGSIASGIHWYDIPQEVLSPMWIYSGAMLGVSVLKSFSK